MASPQYGFAADNLPPKWFTKNPDAAYADEIADMIAVARHAAEIACALPPSSSVLYALAANQSGRRTPGRRRAKILLCSPASASRWSSAP
ncbi:MAG: hypothetical protein WDN28_00150 [Chthoniobacter sp.]